MVPFFIVGLVGSGCAGWYDATKWDEAKVRESAQKRWDMLLAGRVDDSYTYWSSGSRVQVPLERYRATVPRSFWTAAEVASVSCGVERCDVQVAVAYRYVPKLVEIKGHQTIKETWIKESGDWVYVNSPS